MTNDNLEIDLEGLESAEDFLEYFEVDYEPAIVHVNRLHILQRFHNYLEEVEEMPPTEGERRRLYADLLTAAYQDFVKSDARTEKVFRVFRTRGPRAVSVDLSGLRARLPDAS